MTDQESLPFPSAPDVPDQPRPASRTAGHPDELPEDEGADDDTALEPEEDDDLEAGDDATLFSLTDPEAIPEADGERDLPGKPIF